MRETEVLTIPVGELKSGDEFSLKGQWFKVWLIQELEPRKAVPAFNTPAGYLARVSGEVAGYRSTLILDSRLLLQAVMRDVQDNCSCATQSGLCAHCSTTINATTEKD